MNFELKRYLKEYIKKVITDFPEMVLSTGYKIQPSDLGKRLVMPDGTEWDIILTIKAHKVK